ncbi:MAG: hypothetical protein ACRBCS_02820 [Cellvibrionaceae bacterium]
MTKQLTHIISVSLTLFAVGLISNFSHAETIQVPIGQQASNKQNIKRPKTGLKSAQVEADFGSPINKTSAVGTPPISTWVYPEFVVYFEYDHVIHTVLKHTPVASN